MLSSSRVTGKDYIFLLLIISTRILYVNVNILETLHWLAATVKIDILLHPSVNNLPNVDNKLSK